MHARRLVAVSALAFAALVAGACAEPDPVRPHLVVLSVDTLNRGALAAFEDGAPSHPNLDRLADGCTRYLDAVSTASWTLPAHASLFTGRLPHEHGAVHRDAVLHPGVPTLAERLRSAGYETVAFTDGGYLDPHFGFLRGFDRYDGIVPGDAAPVRSDLPRGGFPADPFGSRLFDRAVAFLEGRDGGDPLFLFLHTYAVHDYFKVHPWAAAEVEGDLRPPREYLECLLGTRSCIDEDWRALRELYRAEVRHLDRALPRLFDALSSLAAERPVHFVLLSDHGEALDPTTGPRHHGGWLDPELVRIPLLVCGPGFEGGVVEDPVSLVDLFPSLLDLAGVPEAAGGAGRSLVGSGPRRSPRVAEDHQYVWLEGRRAVVRFDRRRPVGVALLEGPAWWVGAADGSLRRYERRLGPASVDWKTVDGAGEVPGALSRLLDRSAIETRGIVGDELEETLESLGYVD